MAIIVLYTLSTVSGQWSVWVGHEIMGTNGICEHQVLKFIKLHAWNPGPSSVQIPYFKALPVQRHMPKEHLPHLPRRL